MRFSPLFLPLICFTLFSVAVLFGRPLFDPSPLLSFLFFDAESFILVPFDRDRFAVAIAKRAFAFFIFVSVYPVLVCLVLVFRNIFISSEGRVFLASIFSVFSGLAFSIVVWVYDIRFLPFALYTYAPTEFSLIPDRRDLPTILFSILADIYDACFFFSSAFFLFTFVSFFPSSRRTRSFRWFVRLLFSGTTLYFFGGEGPFSDAVVFLVSASGSELWLIYFSFLFKLQRSVYYL